MAALPSLSPFREHEGAQKRSRSPSSWVRWLATQPRQRHPPLCAERLRLHQPTTQPLHIHRCHQSHNHQDVAPGTYWLGFPSTSPSSRRLRVAPKNTTVDQINTLLSENFRGEPTILSSADSTVNVDDATRITIEYLNSLIPSGLPPHCLYLKLGMILMLLRNLNPKHGLCNGTRLILLRVHNSHLVECKIAYGKHSGRVVLIPQLDLMGGEHKMFLTLHITSMSTLS